MEIKQANVELKNNKKQKSGKMGTFALITMCTTLGIILSIGSTLAWFAGNASANNTLFLGGPVEVALTNKAGTITSGDNKLTTTIESAALLPGMAINIEALAKITSSGTNPTPALLRAKVTCAVTGDTANVVNTALNNEISRVIVLRTASAAGWLKIGDYYYYCAKGAEVGNLAVMEDIATSAVGVSIPFVNNKIILPGKEITNASANAQVVFTISFEAIQAFLPDATGVDQPHSIKNADILYKDAFVV